MSCQRHHPSTCHGRSACHPPVDRATHREQSQQQSHSKTFCYRKRQDDIEAREQQYKPLARQRESAL